MRGSTLFGTLARNIGRTRFDPSAVFPLYTARSLHHPITRSAVPINGTASEILSKYSHYIMFRAFVKPNARLSYRFSTDSFNSIPLIFQTFS